MSVVNQAVNFNDILESIRLRLVSVLELNDAYVRSVASDQYKYVNEETFIALRPLPPQPFSLAGGNRRIRPEKRTIRVYINIRSSLDEVGSDKIAINRLCELENEINDALDGYFPRDTNNTVNLTISGLRPVPSDGPPLRKAEDDIGEVYSVLSYEASYLRPNNTPMP